MRRLVPAGFIAILLLLLLTPWRIQPQAARPTDGGGTVTPFQAEVTVNAQADTAQTTWATLTVPAGKKLNLRYVSANCNGSNLGAVKVQTTVNGVTTTYHVQHPVVWNGQVYGYLDKLIDLWADDAAPVTVGGNLIVSQPPLTVSCTIAVSGQLY